jgi:hypothetical protein
MDIYCPKCGEPWDFDSLHEQAAMMVDDRDGRPYDAIFDAVREDFYRDGCKALGSRCSAPDTTVDSTFGLTKMEAASAMYDLLGDDIDGAAAMLDDLRW